MPWISRVSRCDEHPLPADCAGVPSIAKLPEFMQAAELERSTLLRLYYCLAGRTAGPGLGNRQSASSIAAGNAQHACALAGGACPRWPSSVLHLPLTSIKVLAPLGFPSIDQIEHLAQAVMSK